MPLIFAAGALVKGFYLCRDASDSPLFEEPGRAIEMLLNDVLYGSNALVDAP